MFSAAVDSNRSAPRPGTISNVVAHQVGDDRRVTGVVFRDAGFNLAHQVGCHVGGLGVNPTA